MGNLVHGAPADQGQNDEDARTPTSCGRRSLRSPAGAVGSERAAVYGELGGRMDYETCVAAIRADVAEILAMELDCTHDDVSLFDLGLNSLIALELGARLRDLHGLEVSSSTLFDARTIKDLADLVVAADRGRR